MQIKFTVFYSKAVVEVTLLVFFLCSTGRNGQTHNLLHFECPFAILSPIARNTRSLASHVAVKCVSDCKNAVSDLQSGSVLWFCFV